MISWCQNCLCAQYCGSDMYVDTFRGDKPRCCVSKYDVDDIIHCLKAHSSNPEYKDIGCFNCKNFGEDGCRYHQSDLLDTAAMILSGIAER